MKLDQIIQWVGVAYLALSALVAFLTTLGAILPGAAGAWCSRAAIAVGKAVAAVGELRGAPKPSRQVGP